MARKLGNASLGINLEPGGQAPLDARLVVSTKADLIAAESYSAKNYYKGMIVSVQDDGSIYELIDPAQITESSYRGWKRIDAGAAEKVEVVNDLTTGGTDKALSAEQGKVLKQLIDSKSSSYVIPGKLSDVPEEFNAETIKGIFGAPSAIKGAIQNNLPIVLKLDADKTAPCTLAKFDTTTITIELNEGEIIRTYTLTYADDAYSNCVKAEKDVLVVSDIVDNLTTQKADKALSANQGKVLSDKIGSDIAAAKSELIGEGTAGSEDTIKGAKKYTDEEIAKAKGTISGDIDSKISAAKTELVGTDEDTSDKDTIKGAKKYAEEKATAAQSAAASDAQSKADKALQDAKSYADEKDAEIKSAIDNYTVNGKKISTNPTLVKADVGLSNVTNDAQVKRSEMGVASGVATLGEDGKVPASQLPSYVDDVIEIQKVVAAKSNIPTSGLTTGWLFYATAEKKLFKAINETTVDAGTTPEAGKIYIAVADGNKQYRWGGDSAGLVQITSGNLVLGEAQGTAYEGSKGKANADAIKALQQKDTELSEQITQGDQSTLEQAKEYVDEQVATITTNGAKYYHGTISEGNTLSIPAATHKCGLFPSVTVYENGELVEASVSINASGDVTVNWNGSITKIDVVVTGK